MYNFSKLIQFPDLNSISGFRPDEPSSDVRIQIYVPKMKISVNTKSELQLTLVHMQTSGKSITNIGMYMYKRL